MRDTPVAAHIDIELIWLPRGPLFVYPLKYLLLGPSPLSAADNLAIPLWSEQIVAEDILGILGVRPVVEWLGNSGIVS